jgi:hypothetical protein
LPLLLVLFLHGFVLRLQLLDCCLPLGTNKVNVTHCTDAHKATHTSMQHGMSL